MKELKCPNCGAVIPIDDKELETIISQVRTQEFDAEVERRVSEDRRLHEAEEAQRKAEADSRHKDEISVRDQQIAGLKEKLLAEAKGRQADIEKVRLEADSRHKEDLSGKDQEIAGLKEKLSAVEKARQADIEKARLEAEATQKDELSAREQEIAALKEKISGLEKNKALEIDAVLAKAKQEATETLRLKDEELTAKQNAFDREKEALEGQVEYYKNFKSKRSVKLLGEDLEQHCYNLYVQTLAPVMPEATFEKDNEAVKEEGETKATKGDFIFKAKQDGIEYLSVMFEMKNEGEESTTRHRNADFFDKLDKDRKKKSCEYAVLVSMLEMDSDLYNGGIVAVPGYEKMYVVRPDNFITIINLLVQSSRRTLESQKALVEARNERLDVSNFEDSLKAFKDSFVKSLGFAKDRYDDAIKGIDNTITALENVKKALKLSVGHLDTANNKLQDVTVKKLTKGNATMTAAFKEAEAKKAADKAAQEPEDQ